MTRRLTYLQPVVPPRYTGGPQSIRLWSQDEILFDPRFKARSISRDGAGCAADDLHELLDHR